MNINDSFLLTNYKDISIELSSQLLPIGLIKQVTSVLKKDKNKNTQEEKEMN